MNHPMKIKGHIAIVSFDPDAGMVENDLKALKRAVEVAK